MIGVDFAGPLKFPNKNVQDGKAYLVLYACSLTRGIYLELLSRLETSEFPRSLKRFISRRRRPEKIYSGNGCAFVAVAKWFKAVMADEKVLDFLSRKRIQWQLNLSRAPWWGGHFERMVGIVRKSIQHHR